MLRIKISRLVLFCGAGLLLASCAHLSPAFSPTAKPDAKSAMLYGRFSINRHQNIFKSKLALWLQNLENRRNVYAFFDQDQPVYALQVKAGHYRIAGFVALNRTHQIEGRVPFSSDGKSAALSRPFEAAANSEIYLGDYTGHATFDGVINEWKVDSVTNNFAGTTLEFCEKYPNLRSVPVTSVAELQGRLQN